MKVAVNPKLTSPVFRRTILKIEFERTVRNTCNNPNLNRRRSLGGSCRLVRGYQTKKIQKTVKNHHTETEEIDKSEFNQRKTGWECQRCVWPQDRKGVQKTLNCFRWKQLEKGTASFTNKKNYKIRGSTDVHKYLYLASKHPPNMECCQQVGECRWQTWECLWKVGESWWQAWEHRQQIWSAGEKSGSTGRQPEIAHNKPRGCQRHLWKLLKLQ